jgi:hypothetical protein
MEEEVSVKQLEDTIPNFQPPLPEDVCLSKPN